MFLFPISLSNVLNTDIQKKILSPYSHELKGLPSWNLVHMWTICCCLVYTKIRLLALIWATTWENLFMPYANNKGADQPAHSRSLISTLVVRCLDSIIPLIFISEILSLYLTSVAAQAGLNLPWSQTPKTGFLVMRLIYPFIYYISVSPVSKH